MKIIQILFQRLKLWIAEIFALQSATLSVVHPHLVGNSGQVTSHVGAVVARRGAKLVKTPVSFKVLEGPLTFAENGKQEIRVMTNKDGEAEVDVLFNQRGGGVIQAYLTSDPSEMVFFDGRSEGITHRLMIEAPCEVSVEQEAIEVMIYAYDHKNDPVSGADLELTMLLDSDYSEDGEVFELEPGIYKGTLSTKVAGMWEISVSDYTGRVIAQNPLCVRPSIPDKIEILNKENPRIKPPGNEIILPIAVYDKYGNFLDSQIPLVKANDVAIAPIKKVIGDPALFQIQYDSHGNVEIDISVPNSNVVLQEQVTFPAAAFVYEKTVPVGSEYIMPLYLFPGTEREVKEGSLEVVFDLDQVEFKELSRNETEDNLQVKHTAAENKLQISFLSESGLSGEHFKNGLYIAHTKWQCKGEGKTLFSITGGMSPAFKQCDQYMIQKQRPDPKDLCIQVLYMSPIGHGPPAGVRKSAGLFELILNGNWRECCPTINVNVKTMNLQTESRVRIYQAIGRDNKIVIKSKSDYRKFRKAVKSSWEVDSNCLPVFLIDIDIKTKKGRILGLSRRGIGPAVVDPDHAGSRSLTLSHELAHTLGLKHIKPNEPYNIVGRPKGFRLNEDQCEKIRNNPIFQ